MMYGWIIGAILVIVLIIALGRGNLFQRNTRAASGSNNQASPMETLKTRYAKGEIDEAEFEKKKAELEKG
ncbi:MAG: SHOCT domain-containing protein [Bacteroidota bacterium]